VPGASDPQAAGLRQVAAVAKDPDGFGLTSTPEVGSISAQIQRLMQVSADPVRTDGLGLVAPPGADGTSQLNAAGTTPPPPVQMSAPAGAPGWGEELGHRVMWLVGQRENVAELRLDPPELGSLEIRIRQKKDATSVSFVVQSSSAREAVESALPRLRELFAEAGLSLQSMDVSERQSGERRGDEGDRGAGRDTGFAEDRFAGGEPSPRTVWRSGGSIDTYA
jgi:flagellar hook-length control protein FliK